MLKCRHERAFYDWNFELKHMDSQHGMPTSFNNDVVNWLPDAGSNHAEILHDGGTHNHAQIFNASTSLNALRF